MNLKTQTTELKDINWDAIKTELNKLDGTENGFLALENDNGDYVQCAGNTSILTIEYRLNSNPNFKHYVVGKGKDKNPMKVSWVALQNNVGPIMVHKEEVLNIKDAEWVFKEFFENQTIPAELNKRNVTKLHLEK